MPARSTIGSVYRLVRVSAPGRSVLVMTVPVWPEPERPEEVPEYPRSEKWSRYLSEETEGGPLPAVWVWASGEWVECFPRAKALDGDGWWCFAIVLGRVEWIHEWRIRPGSAQDVGGGADRDR